MRMLQKKNLKNLLRKIIRSSESSITFEKKVLKTWDSFLKVYSRKWQLKAILNTKF